MKVLEVIHGYPPQYNAGSENYTQTIAEELAKRGHEITIFCRKENPFQREFEVQEETLKNKKIKKFTINVARTKDRFFVKEIDNALNTIMERIKPDIAHLEHLNHLSLGIPGVLKKWKIPMVYTLHDFWLMCPRGQFLQFNTEGEPWRHCSGQEDQKCASVCYSRYHTGNENLYDDLQYWTKWVLVRMNGIRTAVNSIDKFVSPSITVMDSFKKSFPDSSKKVTYLDYGFELAKLSGRQRVPEKKFVFGYIGTHIPAKGVDHLIRAFTDLKGGPLLRIWGKNRSELTPYLKELSTIDSEKSGNKIEWMGEFNGERIVEQVFDMVDAIVVPSIWLENSPLVIHEAQQCRVPVITANIGGMAEYVKHGVNGLLFEFRNSASLTEQMQTFVNNPDISVELGNAGYLNSLTGDVQSVAYHVDRLLALFDDLKS